MHSLADAGARGCHHQRSLLSMRMISEDSLLAMQPFFLSHSTGTEYLPAWREAAREQGHEALRHAVRLDAPAPAPAS